MFEWNFRWLLLSFIFDQFNMYHVMARWPSPNSSNIQLLGLFENVSSASDINELSVHSRAMFKSAVLLSQQYNISMQGQPIEWKTIETGGSVIDALKKTCQLIPTSNFAGIVGPELSREAHMIAPFARTIGVPVISHSATDPDLSGRNAYPAFFRTVPSDNTIASAIVKLFRRFNWTSCNIIYQNDAFGSGGANTINEAFINSNLLVQKLIIFDIATLSIRGDLKDYLVNSATRIVILWVQPIYTPTVVRHALEVGVLGSQFTWILSSSFSLNLFNETSYEHLIGLFSVEPVIGSIVNETINSTLLTAAYQIWQDYEPESFPGSAKVNFYALFAFDATWTLIRSLEKLCSTVLNSSSSCLSFVQSSFCFDYRFVYSDILLDIISRTEFIGVSGPIKFSFKVADRIDDSYYYAQNVQSSSDGLNFVPILAYSDRNDWKPYPRKNVIVWPGNTLVAPTDRAILKGINLRIGVIESPPFTIVTHVVDELGQNTTKLTGYIPDLIELLRNQMGFIPTIQIAPRNHTYLGLIEAVANGVFDIVIGDVTVNARRREFVDFSSSIFDTSLSIIVRKTSDVDIDFLSFLRPFSRNLWLLVFGTCIYAAVLICVVERQDNETLQNRSIFSQVAMSIWYSFGNIVGYGVDFNVITAAGRLLTGGLYMLSLILLATYTANLASDLTISKSKTIISGINDLKNGRIPFNRIGIIHGSIAEDFYLRDISDGIQNYYPVKFYEKVLDILLANIIDATLSDTATAEYMANNIYCNITLVGEGIDKGIFGVVVPRQWLYLKDLDVNILSLRESGKLDQLRQKWFQKRNCPDSTEISNALRIESMGGLFLIFGILSILSLLLSLWTKRHISKTSLFIMGCLKKLSFQKTFINRHSYKTSDYIQNSQ